MLPGENRSDISILSHTTMLLVPQGRGCPHSRQAEGSASVLFSTTAFRKMSIFKAQSI